MWGILFSTENYYLDYYLRMLSLKELKIVESGIAGLSLFDSIMVDGKKVLLKKLCLILSQGISLVFLVL